MAGLLTQSRRQNRSHPDRCTLIPEHCDQHRNPLHINTRLKRRNVLLIGTSAGGPVRDIGWLHDVGVVLLSGFTGRYRFSVQGNHDR